jgi:disulfide bond formation protein DsbB
MVPALNTTLAALTVASHAVLVVGVVYFLIHRNNRTNTALSFAARHALLFAWLVSCAATALSLVYSEMIGYEPCVLCWYQRIFLYPQIALLGLAWWRRDDHVIDYSLLLALIGGAIALYHTYIGYGGTPLVSCAADGLSDPCAKRYVFEFGYVTIPLMSLTSFLLVLALLGLRRSFKPVGGNGNV